MWQVLQTRRFSRVYKKLNDTIALEVDRAIAALAVDPDLGEKKKGDLAALYVYKFHSQNQLYLLGYTRNDGLQLIYLVAVGHHENFYRDLKH